MDVPHPDEKSILTYVSSIYDVMPRVPNVQEGVKANVSTGPVHGRNNDMELFCHLLWMPGYFLKDRILLHTETST